MYTDLFHRARTSTSWGVLGTLGWFALIIFIDKLVQWLLFGMYVGFYHQDYLNRFHTNFPFIDIVRLQQDFRFDGVVFSLTTLSSFAVSTGLILLIVGGFRKARISRCLALQLPNLNSLMNWFLILTINLALFVFLLVLISEPITPDFIKKLYVSAEPQWLLLMSLMILRPITHEIVFRGFLLSDLASSRLTPIAAILITSAIWAATHYQLEPHLVVIIFLLGAIFGMARIQSRSILVPIIMHMTVNALVIFLIFAGVV